MRKITIKSAGRILCVVAIAAASAGYFMAQPTARRNRGSAVKVDPGRLRAHVVMLSQTLHPRDWTHVENLDKCASYVGTQFTNAGAEVAQQVFDVQGRQYRNVIGRFGAGRGSRIVVGAHYDARGQTPGADDNASGVAALVELAYLLGRVEPDREVELVAYTLEEPPFFRTQSMGSALHAKSLAGEATAVTGVIVLEMVGCFKDDRGSQSYPVILLRLIYPGRGNFIAVTGRWDQGDWIKSVKAGMKGATDLPVYSIRAPTLVPGVDFSDHLNYWPYGINALMVTDTAFYRNHAYHSADDTAETLDFKRLGEVAVAVFAAIQTR